MTGALRALKIELGLADGVSKPLTALDKQINGVESGLIGMQSEFDALERSTTDFGRTAGRSLADVEDGIAGVDDAVVGLEDQIEDTAAVTVRSAMDMSESFAKVGAAIGAAAVATEAYLRSQQDMYYAADKIAYITDMDRREVIGLAADLNNLSFSLEDAYGVMEVGARQGLRTQSELEQYARFWDAIGTASGEDATDLARRAVALQSVNIQAGDLAETTDTLGFVMTHTNVGIGQYLNLVGDMAKKMDAYDLSIEDTAVMLAALEERGLAAEKSTEILQSAMNKAKGDTGALYRELGITEDQVARLNEEIKGGSDYINAMGEAYNDAQTPLQWVQMEAGKIGHALGADLNPLLEVGSVAMAGMSSALLMGASAAYLYSVASTTSLIPSLGAATASAWAFTTALLANPLTWIVVGIVALGAALYLLWTNWDEVSGWFMGRWEEVGSVATGAIDWIGNAWDSTVGAIVAGVDWLGDKLQFFGLLFPFTAPIAGMHLLRDNWDSVTGAIAGGWDWLAGAAQDGAAWLGETIGAGLSGIIDLFWQYHPLGIVIRQWDEITGYLEGIDLVETGRDILLGLVNGILDIRQQAIDAVMGIGEDILNAVTGFFGIRSPSRLMQEMGHHVGEGFALGVGESMPDSIPFPEAVEGGYATVWTEPTAPSLAGEAVYSSALAEPVVGDLTGRAIYSSTLTEPAVGDLAGTVAYDTQVSEPSIPALGGTVEYGSTLTEPTITPLTGSVEYRPDLVEPDYLTGAREVRYTSVVGEPSVKDLIGSVTYQASLEEPRIPTLTGGAQYTSTLTEPAITDLAGTATYRAYLDGIEPDALQGEVTYLAKVVEPVISALTGDLTYETHVSEPTIVDRAGTVVYETEMSEPTIAALTGAITYLATVMEPMIPALSGIVEFRGMVGVPALEDMEPYGLPESGDLWSLYTPERDAPMMAGSTATTYAPSTTINVTTGSGDAREIATVVDRRLRQTFDRHAETYFARQRRRAAL